MRHVALGIALSLGVVPALAQDGARPALRLPILELGVAGGGGLTPDYPAADQSHWRGLFTPYLIYRGDLFRADEGGARLRGLRSGNTELALSASGAFPASSRDNRAREGMPDLDWLGEIGPTLRITLHRDTALANPRRLLLDLPLRLAFSTDLSSVEFRGATFEPDLVYEQNGLLFRNSRLRMALGMVLGSQEYMDYFYGVPAEFARPGRTPFTAEAVYLGTRLQISYRIPVTERLSVVVGGRISNFSGATNAESPLYRSEWGFAVAAGIRWILYRSEHTIEGSIDPFL
jgi:outer membrane scaffolding protein for murein synthesis (MipA/OmpV family)